MEFDLTTFILEIVNFLVLVWILARLLYRPVLDAITERRKGIELTLEQARASATEAQALRVQYERRMQDWEQEKVRAHAALRTELDTERARLMSVLLASIEEERAKARTLQQQHAAELHRRLAEQAWSEGARFVARLLQRIANPALEERIHRLVLEDLGSLGEAERQALHAAGRASEGRVEVRSRWPLAEAQRNGLSQALGDLVQRSVRCEFEQDSDLIAGLRIGIGPWLLRANLCDELRFFFEPRHA